MLKPQNRVVTRNKTPFSLFLFPFSLFLFTFLSCQTAPKIPDFSLDGRLPLEPGAYVYLLAEKDAIPMLSQLGFTNINNAQFQQMLDLTHFVTAAIYTTPNKETDETGKLKSFYRLAAWGGYPASRAKFALNSSKEWKKKRSPVSGADYWHSAQGDISVAIIRGMALAATAVKNAPAPTDPYSAATGTALPDGFALFREGSLLSCWITDPGPAINQQLGKMGIPLEIPAQQLFISLYPADEQPSAGEQQYKAQLQIQVDNANQARMLTMMFALARNFIPPPLSILFANSPVQDGTNLNITTDPLSVREIALLLKMFSL
jgi:hypothetical protein